MRHTSGRQAVDGSPIRARPNSAFSSAAIAYAAAVRSHVVGQRHRLVGALQELDGHEDHVLVAQVFQIVDFELARSIGLVPRLTGCIGVLDGRAVMHVLASAAARHRRPEIVEHVTVEADPFTRLEADGPDPDAIGLGYQSVADAGVRIVLLALELRE